MNISKKSWHYKLNSFMSRSFSMRWDWNLCRYFWRTVGSLLQLAVFLLLVMLVGIGLGIGTITAFTTKVDWVVTGSILLIIIVVYCLIKSFCRFNAWIKTTPNLSLLRDYVKAKKQKVCPIIDFVE